MNFIKIKVILKMYHYIIIFQHYLGSCVVSVCVW